MLSRALKSVIPASARAFASAKAPLRVVVTGPAGAIGYAMLFRIASGEMLGKDQPIELRLLELPGAMKALGGCVMELDDCAFPLLTKVVQTDKLEVAFDGADFACLVGAKPRGPGMERSDLLKDNGAIFSAVGKAMNKHANKNIKTCVVGNPANTNCLIAAANAPDINPANFTAMTRLDHNRGLGQLAIKTNCSVNDISKFCIWGNHSPTMYPDITHCSINGKKAIDAISNDTKWLTGDFMPTVQKRGAAIIAARGASSAASAGAACIDHIRDWHAGTGGAWTSMAVHTDGTQYGVPKGLYFSFPVTCTPGSYSIVKGLTVDKFSQENIDKTTKELIEERDAVKHLIP